MSGHRGKFITGSNYICQFEMSGVLRRSSEFFGKGFRTRAASGKTRKMKRFSDPPRSVEGKIMKNFL